MRSVRMLLATAAASAVLTLTAPGVYAAEDWNHDDSSYSKEDDNGGKHDSGGYKDSEHDNGGKHDSGGYKDSEHDNGGKHDSGGYKDSEHDKGGWSSDHDKPHGGMHTGGGALDAPTVTAGGLAVLAVAGTGLYAARRRNSAHGTA
ncbi:hypothetical protein StrepF001_09510 [Streptomyces sp. F001]|uniref:hypothetical protein n=1 Tax=Streptomyces sp. F001 TaxID=1510026 RepID=UPI00101E23C0|nr:hypothetical protein [Streptomyces sp. F001]RZB19127.1 hypothetical protein StrepF001_09510 [Streptomyces sp. F001]